ncbi:tRNA-dihydrouridine synthase B [uncultured archaeon]|nr:tRNA-dihydrouridine synthase B [uncultured archaeon]
MQVNKIGNLNFKNRFFLAPMLEPNDIAFRILCKKSGSGLNFTGMYSPRTKEKIFLEDKPAIQIMCNSTDFVKEFIKKYDSQVSLWDLNLGCPSPIAKRNEVGVFLQDKPEKIEEILKIMRLSTEKPITIKLRKSSNTLPIIKMAEKYVDAICIHPRTKDQGYSGKPDLEFAELVKKSTKLPVIYSGNVNKVNCKELLKKFDFLMIGREAIGNPSIFSELLGKTKQKITFFDYLKLAEKYGIKYAQIKFQAMNFTKGLKNAKEIREKLVSAKNLNDIKEAYKTLKN